MRLAENPFARACAALAVAAAACAPPSGQDCAEDGSCPSPREPTASIEAQERPCLIDFGAASCQTTLTITSSSVDAPHLLVSADGEPLACVSSNQRVQLESPSLDEKEVLIEVRPTPSCDGEAGAPALVSMTLSGRYPRPVCSLTGAPLRKVPEDFLGIITFELYGALGTVDGVARRVSEARAAHNRIAVHWSKVQPEPDQPYAFAERDGLIDAFVSRGVAPLLTLGYPPAWASSAPAGTPANLVGNYPPASSAMAKWGDYVRTTVRRYKDRVHDWQVWNEPDYSFRTAVPGNAHLEYVALLNRTVALIRQEDPSAIIWAPDVVVGHVAPDGRPSAEDFATETLLHGDLDRFTFHTFTPSDEGLSSAVRAMVAQVEQYSELSKTLRPELPIAVTAAQVLAPAPHPPTCPYIGNTELEQAQALNDVYACLANAGADWVFWYKTIDRGLLNPDRQTYKCFDAQANPLGTELSGVLGPHPLGKAAEYDGACMFQDCSGLEHAPKASFWALKSLGLEVARQR